MFTFEENLDDSKTTYDECLHFMEAIGQLEVESPLMFALTEDTDEASLVSARDILQEAVATAIAEREALLLAFPTCHIGPHADGFCICGLRDPNWQRDD